MEEYEERSDSVTQPATNDFLSFLRKLPNSVMQANTTMGPPKVPPPPPQISDMTEFPEYSDGW